MNEDRIKGAAKTVKGEIKKAVGKLIDDKDMEMAGDIEKKSGKLQTSVGLAKDAIGIKE